MATEGLTGQSQTIGASEELIFDGDSYRTKISTICVRCDDASPASVVIRIPDLHGDEGGAVIPAGEKEYFRVGHKALRQVYASGNGAVIDWFGSSATVAY